MAPVLVQEIESRRTWFEIKILRGFHSLFTESLNRMRDVSYVIAIDTRRLRAASIADWLQRSWTGLPMQGAFQGGVADLVALRELPSLPETAAELASLARATGADPKADLLLGAQATEARVRRLLAGEPRRVVVFATHGLVAGELTGLAEPALVVTPPPGEAGGEADDGLLTASEIASALRLDADWVILSACNTAAPDGTPGALGLSGLAKAFFYAGSRALLVSHWAVYSTAAVRLTTRTLDELAKHPVIGRAQAHRRAMLALLDDASEPSFAHPAFWAPFVVVGEGGTYRPAPEALLHRGEAPSAGRRMGAGAK
jgi:CHAT domain-containing protein